MISTEGWKLIPFIARLLFLDVNSYVFIASKFQTRELKNFTIPYSQQKNHLMLLMHPCHCSSHKFVSQRCKRFSKGMRFIFYVYACVCEHVRTCPRTEPTAKKTKVCSLKYIHKRWWLNNQASQIYLRGNVPMPEAHS